MRRLATIFALALALVSPAAAQGTFPGLAGPNTVVAGPTGGPAALPVPRSLVAGDINGLAPSFSGLTVTSLVSAGTQCVQASSSGVLSVTGSACGSGAGAVNTVTNSDGTLTISPTTGNVVASLALGHANTWTALQTFNAGIAGGSGAASSLTIESTSGAGTTDTILFKSGSQVESFRVDTAQRIVIGGTAALTDAIGTNLLEVAGTTNTAALSIYRFTASASSPKIGLVKSRGASIGTHAALISGDNLGSLLYEGDDGTNYLGVASLAAVVDGAVSTGIIPSRLVLTTVTSGGVSNEALRLDSSQRETLNSSGTGNVFGNLLEVHNFSNTALPAAVSITQWGGSRAQFIGRRTPATTTSTHSLLGAGANVVSLDAIGDDGAAFQLGAQIVAQTEGTPALGQMPMHWSFNTQTQAGSLTEGMRLDSNQDLTIGPNANSGSQFGGLLELDQAGTTTNMFPSIWHEVWNSAAGNGAAIPLFQFFRSRGSAPGIFSIVQSGDLLGLIRGTGADGSTWQIANEIDFIVDSTPSAGKLPGRMTFNTTDSSGNGQERMRLESKGIFYTGNSNIGGVFPLLATTGPGGSLPETLAIGWNETNGGRDVSLINLDASPATQSFTFWQMTGASAISKLAWIDNKGGFASNDDVPVTAFGAKCDGSTNDTSAINSAIASGYKNILITGTCNVTTLNTLPTNLTLHGRNRMNDIIQTTVGTGNVITMANGDVIHDLGFKTSVTRTAGDYIFAGVTVNLTLYSLYMQDFWSGIHLAGAGFGGCPVSTDPCSGMHAWDLNLYGSNLTNGSSSCILLDGSSGTGQPYNVDVKFDNVLCSSGTSAGGITTGVDIKVAGDASFNHLQVIFAGIAVHVEPSGSPSTGNWVQAVYFVNSFLDSGGVGLKIDCTSGSSVGVVYFLDGWSATMTNSGIFANTDNTCQGMGDLHVVSSTVANNANDIVFGANSNILNATIANNQIGGGGAGSPTGVLIGGSVSNIHILNNMFATAGGFPPPTNSVGFLGSGNTNITIIGNDMHSTTPISIGGGVSIPGFISNNIGYHSGTPSLTCTGGSITGNDYSGTITNVNTNCAWTFANTFQTAPNCTWTDLTTTRTGQGTAIFASNVQVGGLTGGDTISYICSPSPNN